MRLVIVGGGPAGLSAARAYRAAGGDGDVTMITGETALPYNRPPLSKDFLRGEMEDSELPIEDEAWYQDHDVTVRLGGEVERLDPHTRALILGSGETLRYDACVLATGAEPKVLPIPGATEDWVLLLRSLATARVLQLRAESARTAIVVGSGFIGCEAAASLAMRGIDVTLASDEDIPHASRLGEEAGRRITQWLEDLGVTLRLGVQVDALEEDAADLILMATGVEPRAGLAETAGLELHEGRVVVDDHMRTSVDGVYAAGDVAYALNAAAGRPLAVEHWGEALNMGEVAGRTIAGDDSASWNVAPGFWSTIGEHTLKYVAWGDGFDATHLREHRGGGWTVWYSRDDTIVGVLTHERDGDYERGRELVEAKAPVSRI
jgi:3-phenylpropionate/trans-cinnamate dioxygenase ferredoxin reductase component